MLNKRIKLLSPYTINQIAAGEVIERPASVLKELLENSIDAHATQIDVLISLGGLQAIEVRDNGQGICKEDLALAIAANATSKLNEIDDLLNLHTLGFRGEALASIDAVADLQITSRPHDAELAWTIADGQVLPSSHPAGTSIKVSNLFYKVPVRKKFLRSARSEFIYVEQIWIRTVLSNFNIAFSLYHNDHLIKKLSACHTPYQQEQRLFAIIGNLKNKIIQVNAQHERLALHGWIIIPEHAPTTTDHQYIYLNQRSIKDKLLIHAIKEAYAKDLLPGKQPLYCLYLTAPSQEFDVNVHPTKLEVRFRAPRVIHDFLLITLRDCLQVPVHEITHTGYKIPLQTAIAPLTHKVLTLLDNRVLVVEENNQLSLIDILKLKNTILVAHLNFKRQLAKYSLSQPLTYNYDFAKLKLSEFNRLGFEIEQLNTHTIVVRTIPQLTNDLQLSIDYEKLFNVSKATNLIDALCANTHWLQLNDPLRLLSIAEELAISSESYKRSYNSEQLVKLLS